MCLNSGVKVMLEWEYTSLSQFLGDDLPIFKTKPDVEAFLERLKTYGEVLEFEANNRIADVFKDIIMSLLIGHIKSNKIDSDTLNKELKTFAHNVVLENKAVVLKLASKGIEAEKVKLDDVIKKAKDDIHNLSTFKKSLHSKKSAQKKSLEKWPGKWVDACTGAALTLFVTSLKNDNKLSEIVDRIVANQANLIILKRQAIPPQAEDAAKHDEMKKVERERLEDFKENRADNLRESKKRKKK